MVGSLCRFRVDNYRNRKMAGYVKEMSSGGVVKENVIVWFRNDLRLRDNEVLHSKPLEQAKYLVGVYCLDDRFENKFTRKFRQESVADLSRSFARKFGVPLLVFNGRPENVIPALVEKVKGDGLVICSTEVTNYEKKVDETVKYSIRNHGWDFLSIWNYSMYHPDDISFPVLNGDVPEPYTAFRQRVEDKKTPIRCPLEIPNLSHVSIPVKSGEWSEIPGYISDAEEWADPSHISYSESRPNENDTFPVRGRHVLRFRGGEDAALLRLEHFCDSSLSRYKSVRNRSVGWEYSSKLSPWLAAGCISPRQIHHRISDFEKLHGESVDTYWVTFELLWRDYMRFFSVKHGDRIFYETGPARSLPKGVEWSDGTLAKSRFEAWKNGKTGIPWVDGHMRELNETGFMSNRGRQNVASFLVHNLNVDWRLGAKYFEDNLIDHDVTANYCNWIMAAGVGFRSQRVNRFNMDKQARDYDPKGEHAVLWIPELKVPQGKVAHDLALRPAVKDHTLEKWFSASKTNAESMVQKSLNGGLYPMPIVKIVPSKIEPDKMKRSKRLHTGKTKTFYTT